MKLALVLAAVAGTTILAAGEFRIDLTSTKSNIDLEIREHRGNLKSSTLRGTRKNANRVLKSAEKPSINGKLTPSHLSRKKAARCF